MPAILAFIQNIALLLIALGILTAQTALPQANTSIEPSSAPDSSLYSPPLPVDAVAILSQPVATTSASTTASTTPPAKVAKAPQKAPVPLPKIATSSIATTTKQTPVKPLLTLQEAVESITKLAGSPPPTDPLNTLVRNALVNILCTVNGDSFNSAIGSGVIIDPRGVILTNAHVAQLMLLKDHPTPNNVECVARVGSPAVAKYKLETLFISPEWITRNAHKIAQTDPTGNGEFDYALLRITGPIGDEQLPSQFPFVNVSLSEVNTAQNVLVAGYAAGFLDTSSILKNLYASSAIGQIKQIFTYGTSTIDVYSLTGTVVSQKGSSGGAVTDINGLLIGLIVTATMDASTAERTHNAISTPYIVRNFEIERGKSLASVLSGDLESEARVFQVAYAPKLRGLLINALPQQ